LTFDILDPKSDTLRLSGVPDLMTLSNVLIYLTESHAHVFRQAAGTLVKPTFECTVVVYQITRDSEL